MRFKGTIADWKDARGFGFIIPAEGGSRVFCHVSAFRDRGARPANGQRVTYEIGSDGRGRTRAQNVGDSLTAAPSATPTAEPPPAPPHLGRAIFIAGAFLLALPTLAATGHLRGVVPVWYLAIGVVTLCAYALDKLAAERRGWRVSEARLQMLALAGGWPIAWVAQQLFRHKTRKHEFRKVFRFCVAANLIVLGAVIWVGGDPINLVKELASHLQKQGLQAEGM